MLKAPGIGLMLKANDDVVSVSHHDDVAMGMAVNLAARPSPYAAEVIPSTPGDAAFRGEP
jgi:hypothetical protein